MLWLVNRVCVLATAQYNFAVGVQNVLQAFLGYSISETHGKFKQNNLFVISYDNARGWSALTSVDLIATYSEN